VNNAARARLADNPSSLTEAFAKGARTFADAGGPQAYFGFPRHASAAEGEQSFAIMAEGLATAIKEALSVAP
jgi:creatinine amidohydrolase